MPRPLHAIVDQLATALWNGWALLAPEQPDPVPLQTVSELYEPSPFRLSVVPPTEITVFRTAGQATP